MESQEIITAFKQGKRGNCVSIAAIKAAMRQYGVDNVFRNVDTVDDSFQIEMRDGFKTVLRKHEIVKGTKFSRFNKGNNDDIRRTAYFYFTAMAKRVYVEGEIDVFLGRRTLRGALRSLNNGENYMEGINWLGLNNNYKVINQVELYDHRNVIGASSKHCFFIGDNKYVDDYGGLLTVKDSFNQPSFEFKHLVALT